SYDWNFLELEKSHAEKELENALLDKIEKVLLEFGKGFAFMESQLKILIAGQYHKIDLVFYHRLLKCIVLVELKTEKFRRDFVAQMNEYLTYIREHNKLEGERDPIGLIICKEKNEEEVHYALGRLKHEIFVAEYKTKLPSEEEIKSKLKDAGK
ncbi:MAG: PDDEXK nuclease domain-containing protein, partial [Nanoarchaeota archaeon]